MAIELGTNPLRTVHRIVGDTSTPLGFALQQGGAARDVTGDYVLVKMVAADGTVKMAATNTGVTITDAAAGEGQFDFPASAVDEAGDYWLWVIVERGGPGGERDTFPADGRRLRIRLHAAG